jgi:hypothetical protein
MINATVNAKGDLVITASKASSANDFDFLAGKWTMDNKRLKTRLNNCTEWVEYKSDDENYGPVLNGIANIDIYRTSYNQVNDKPYEGLTLRLFNPQRAILAYSILLWWARSREVLERFIVKIYFRASRLS